MKISNSKKRIKRNLTNVKTKIESQKKGSKHFFKKSRSIILNLIMLGLIGIFVLGLFFILYIITSICILTHKLLFVNILLKNLIHYLI